MVTVTTIDELRERDAQRQVQGEMEAEAQVQAQDTTAEPAGEQTSTKQAQTEQGVEVEVTEGYELTEAQKEPYPVPVDGRFGSAEVIEAADLRQMGNDFIDGIEELAWLRDRKERIAWRWVQKGGSSGQQRKLGATDKPNKFYRADVGAVLVIWLAADNLRALNIKRWQVEALVLERLAAVKRDKPGRVQKKAPEFSGYFLVLKRYPPFTPQLRRAADIMTTTPDENMLNGRLFDRVDEDEDDEDED